MGGGSTGGGTPAMRSRGAREGIINERVTICLTLFAVPDVDGAGKTGGATRLGSGCSPGTGRPI